MMKRYYVVCLFDLDGTVIDSRRMGIKAMELACRELYGWEKPLEGILIAGRTDRRIFKDIFVKFCGKLPSRKDWEKELLKFKENYLAHLERLLMTKRPVFNPGFPNLIKRVENLTGVKPGIVTGNFQRGAELKLISAGVSPSIFGFGSFGCEAEDRKELLGLAKERAKSLIGRDLVFVVVGDTPEDFHAAKSADMMCALVATGPYSYDALSELKPDFIEKDFSDSSSFLNWLNSISLTGLS